MEDVAILIEKVSSRSLRVISSREGREAVFWMRADIARMKHRFDWVPKVPLEKGIKETWQAIEA